MDMEKIYLTMKRTGAGNIVLGILSICIGLASGIMPDHQQVRIC